MNENLLKPRYIVRLIRKKKHIYLNDFCDEYINREGKNLDIRWIDGLLL